MCGAAPKVDHPLVSVSRPRTVQGRPERRLTPPQRRRRRYDGAMEPHRHRAHHCRHQTNRKPAMTRRITRLSLAGLIVAGFANPLPGQSSSASTTPPNVAAGRDTSAARIAKPTIVLVHGAFADGSGWHRVIPLLERDGYTVVAVQNPLTSFSTDVETTKRVIDAQLGPVIAVGHSYRGAVITEAAAGSPRVKALVYVAAFAPEVGE